MFNTIYRLSFRGLALSTDLYLEIFRRAELARYVTFDLLRSRVRHVINTSYALRVSEMLLSWGCLRIEDSYEVDTPNGVEKFEKVTIRRRPVTVVLKMTDAWRAHSHLVVSLFVLFWSFILYRFFIMI